MADPAGVCDTSFLLTDPHFKAEESEGAIFYTLKERA